ncbi:MAG: pyridoxal-phosphate dependent enzyme [bacterium]|nr:pyridoxal-phosphate dependent enzyme [bacterium]
MKFSCSLCGQQETVSTRKAHCDCGGLWKLDFQPPKFDPEKIDRDEWSMFRYREFMALDDDTSWRGVTLGEGMTPIVRLDREALLKMDYFMPTMSFKDRGAAVLIAHCQAIGADRVVQDSSGNAGNAVAAYCAKAGIACEIFVPEGTSPKKIDMIRAHGAVCTVVPGNRDHCADVSPLPTLAEGIAIGKPMRGREILEYAGKHGVRFVHVPENKILAARAALALKGIYCEHTTAANYAGYLAYCEQYGPAPDCLITMCGAGLKSDH